jgi:predicted regulator of Ras-like GTPase activity (Roadblock/LC7/MglB family)
MQSVLKNLNVIPGIIGGLLADANGSLLAHSFPPLFDVSALQTVCEDVKNSLVGMQDATGGVKLLDLRFDHGRVIVKRMPTYFLLLLCEQQVNLPLLLISINVAVNNLEPLVAKVINSRQTAVQQSIKADVSSTSLDKIIEKSIATGMV